MTRAAAARLVTQVLALLEETDALLTRDEAHIVALQQQLVRAESVIRVLLADATDDEIEAVCVIYAQPRVVVH